MLVELSVSLATIFLLLLLMLYRHTTKNFGKWKAMGVPHISGQFPSGSHPLTDWAFKHLNEFHWEDYNRFRGEKFYGTYLFGKPCLNLRDPELIRWVMVKNFDSFVDRNDSNIDRVFDGGEYDQFWRSQLTSLRGNEWKNVRCTFSPVFTSGKMRGMIRFIKEVTCSLTKELHSKAELGNDFELKEVFGKFSLDSLATCIFGIDPHSFEKEQSTFVKNAKRIFTMTFYDRIMIVARLIPGVQWFHKRLNINTRFPKETHFFLTVVRQTIANRKNTKARNNDLIDLMIDCLKQTEKTDLDDNEQNEFEKEMKLSYKTQNELNEDAVVATAMMMLVAGYDTTAMTLAFMAYYLAENPSVQVRLQQEIDDAYEKHDGFMPDYSTIMTLPYLDMCIMETLRMESIIGVLIRTCTADCTLPGTDIVIKKDDLVAIPAIGLHRDDQYYPNPDVFDPNRFSKEAKQSRHPYTFLPFGHGPRACIGTRFALLEMKTAMMEILHNFTFSSSRKSPSKLKIDPDSQMGYVKGGLFAKITVRSGLDE